VIAVVRGALAGLGYSGPQSSRRGEVTSSAESGASGPRPDDGRITASLPTLATLMACDAKVIVSAHLGRPGGKLDPKDGQWCRGRKARTLPMHGQTLWHIPETRGCMQKRYDRGPWIRGPSALPRPPVTRQEFIIRNVSPQLSAGPDGVRDDSRRALTLQE